ncbi:MAG: hypothetical protein IPM29_09035 [Planctomycetes bacterium]|nr:hypothetical protein [Planctomycetota bacterium]
MRCVPLSSPAAATAVLAATLSLAAPATAQRSDRARPAREQPALEHLTYRDETFRSEALGGRETSFGIYLPADYDAEANATRTWPLVVWLHGMWEDHDRFATRGGGQVLDKMVGDGEFPAAIFVTAEGDRSSFWIDGVAKDRGYETMVVHDLLDHVAATWRVDPDPRHRAIAGVSMGGYGALKIALKHPDRFGVVAAHSAAILPEDQEKLFDAFPRLRGRGEGLVAAIFGDPIDAERWRAENVLTIARSLDREALDGLKIYFDCGLEDRYGFQVTNTALHELLDERRIPHTWRPVEGGGHGWQSGYNTSELPQSLRFIQAQWTQERGARGLEGLLTPPGGGGAGEGTAGGGR